MSGPADKTTTPEELLAHAPEPVKELILREPDATVLQCVAQHDLDEQGRYVERWMVLTEKRVGLFHKAGDHWDADWLDLEHIDETLKLIEEASA